MGKWLTMSDTVATLGVSERTIQRRVKAGRLETKLDANGHKLIFLSDEELSTLVGDNDRQIEADKLRAEIASLKAQLEEKDAMISVLQERLAVADQQLERQQILSLNQQRLLEQANEPFWRRWFKHKALPAPGEAGVVDAEMASEEESNT